jgi:hypothetical protein
VDSLEIRRIKADLVMKYTFSHEKANLNFNDFFVIESHPKTGTNVVKLTGEKIDIRKYSFTVRTAEIWNQISLSVVLAKSRKVIRT